MSIDDKHLSAWTETDLQELCDAQRRETPRLEFKRELVLDRDRDKNEVEHDVQGLANAGGGYLIYGVAERELPDGSKAASHLVPLVDGGLYERLNNLLDGRGTPKVPFELAAINASDDEGIYLAVEVLGRRRPHMANDGRYYLRRNLLVRAMTEAEIADAYRERFQRESQPVPEREGRNEVGPAARARQGLNEAELALYRQETGREGPPGWLSVVSIPIRPEPDLLDPFELDPEVFRAIPMDDRWREAEAPLTHFHVRRSLDGFEARLPDRDDTFPYYLFHFWPDGLLEYGDLLEPMVREDERPPAVIATHAVAEYIHDSLLLFGRIYSMVNYDDDIKVRVRFDHVLGAVLAVDPARAGNGLHPVDREVVEGRPWTGPAADLEHEATPIAFDALRRVFLAAGGGNPYFFDAQGNYIGRD